MNFYITISNGLVKDGHRQKMGTAVWEFMWLLDKITKVDDNGCGWVLGGKPIKLDELKADLQTSTPKISANISKLRKQGYIETENTGHGLLIKVLKAQKRFNQKVKAEFTKREKQNVQKVKPLYIDKTVDKTIDTISKDIGEFGNSQINDGVELLTSFIGKPPQLKQNRFTLQRLFRSKGYERTLKAMRFALEHRDDQYCPVISNYMDLEKKWASLETFARRKTVGKAIYVN